MDPRLTVAYSEGSSRLELEVAGRIIWSGAWQFELECQGKAITIESPWEEVCWVSDDDADYVEIEARLTDGFRLQRQIMLARKDRLLFLGDAVLGPTADHAGHARQDHSANRLTYTARLPLAEGIRLEPAAETREAWLVGPKVRLAVLPLALAEWRVDPASGRTFGRGRPVGPASIGRRAKPLRAAVDRSRSQTCPPRADLAAPHRGRHQADSKERRRRRLPCPVGPGSMARLSLAGCRLPHGPCWGKTWEPNSCSPVSIATAPSAVWSKLNERSFPLGPARACRERARLGDRIARAAQASGRPAAA